jgi:glycosyltransferase involved in cell wall biosynthesis
VLLEEEARSDARIRVFGQPRQGIHAALNAGILEANGEYIARMDGDDMAHPERLAVQVAHLARRPCVGLVASRARFGGDRSTAGGFGAYLDWSNAILSSRDIYLNRFVESPLAHPSVMFRRTLVSDHGGYLAGDEPEDYELWLRWLQAGVRMEKIDRELIVWNDSPSRLSRTDERYTTGAFYRCKSPYIAQWVRTRCRNWPVWIWGAGRTARKRAGLLRPFGIDISAYVDIDPAKIGGSANGVPVVGPESIPPPGSCLILSYVGSRGAGAKIREKLFTRGYREGRDFYLAA